MATEKLKRYKSPVCYQNLAELIQAEGRTKKTEIQKLITSVRHKICLKNGRSLLSYLLIKG
jgi:hypothetical protein